MIAVAHNGASGKSADAITGIPRHKYKKGKQARYIEGTNTEPLNLR